MVMEDLRGLLPDPDPQSIDPEIWMMAEQRIQEVLYVIQPNLASDKKRKEVVSYVQQLIKKYFGTEVLGFGSVPLKTYLPDGDVDLTVFCYHNLTEYVAQELCNVLHNSKDGAEVQIKDIQYIDAQVKVVKCTMKGGTAVDISFNQISGLCTLCFLEQADQRIGKDHLFKRSVVLIKAWCYYESRLLGAHHGLLSTYALETMVLYIVSIYHDSLRGPLEVLYKFLDYYSQFDWERNCLTVHGPLDLSALAQGTTESPEGDGRECYLSKGYVKHCKNMFGAAMKAYDSEAQEFTVKHLNILDPLKDNNNLGRSVGLGSFNRIIPAFARGLRKLQKILMLPGVNMGQKLEKLFEMTLERNGRSERPDLRVPVPAFGTGKYEAYDLNGDSQSCFSGLWYLQMYNTYTYKWDKKTLTWRMRPAHNGLDLGGNTYEFGTPFFPRNPVPHHSAKYGSFKPKRSGGTGTFIPVMKTPDVYKETSRKERDEIPDPVRQDLRLRPARRSGKAVVEENHRPSEIVREEKRIPFELSLDAFPFLPGLTHPVRSEISQPGMSHDPSSSACEVETEEMTRLQLYELQNDEEFPPQENRRPSEIVREENRIPFDLSIDAFPFLPGLTHPVRSDISQPGTSHDPSSSACGAETKEMTRLQLYELQNDEEFPPL